MEILNQLEPYPRGAYTGTIGLIRPGGDCIFNVAIRTVVIDSHTGEATFGVGGGITIDSTAGSEYEECMVKARLLELRTTPFDLFESILLEEGEYFLFERHLQRLKDSAEFFDFSFSEIEIRSSLANVRNEKSAGSWKVKLVLSKNGETSVEMARVEAVTEWRVSLANRPVDSNNRFLFHKTTQREFYNSELQACAECDDVIFFNERGEVTESSVANVVVKLDGKLITPQVSSGLLAGTFRDHLIAEGQIEEGVISLDDLSNATEIYLINSVRKWIKVSLVQTK